MCRFERSPPTGTNASRWRLCSAFPSFIDNRVERVHHYLHNSISSRLWHYLVLQEAWSSFFIFSTKSQISEFKFFWAPSSVTEEYFLGGSRGLRSTRTVLRPTQAQNTHKTRKEIKSKWSVAKRSCPYIWLRAHCSVTLAHSFHCVVCSKEKKKK